MPMLAANTSAPTPKASALRASAALPAEYSESSACDVGRPYLRLSARTVLEKKEAPTKALVRPRTIIAARIAALIVFIVPPMDLTEYGESLDGLLTLSTNRAPIAPRASCLAIRRRRRIYVPYHSTKRRVSGRIADCPDRRGRIHYAPHTNTGGGARCT